MLFQLETPIGRLKGVGPKRAGMFAEAGICTVEDLLKYQPLRYEDRSSFRRIKDLELAEEAVIEGEIGSLRLRTTAKKRMQIFEMSIRDESGSLPVKFFNQPYLDRVFRKGQSVILYGTPRSDDHGSAMSMINPEYEILEGSSKSRIHTGRIVPIYRRIDRMSTRLLRQLIFSLLSELSESVPDWLSPDLRAKYAWPDLQTSFRGIHFPETPRGVSNEVYLKRLHTRRTPSYRRFIFEEFFFLQLAFHAAKAGRNMTLKGRVIQTGKRIEEAIQAVLPFRPTSAQERVLAEILDDLCGTRLMNRLLQGDVGSGKTIVALQAMIVVIENGYQTALMAPTEILAEQHYKNLLQYLRETPYRLAFLSGSMRGQERSRILRRVCSGQVDLLVGTHALIQESVQFENLGMVVIDEQHRFGVLQRSKLVEKGNSPETLVMTATPIPRSLALTRYGDLDLSVIDELPPGRSPVKTMIESSKSRNQVHEIIRCELKKGRQAFVVHPVIEESQKMDLRGARRMAEQLRIEVFPEYTVGLMHGRLTAAERENLMDRFQKAQVQVLVSTTVIEVGINVPNATIMVIEHAERFGLSQLHQLRGRVGRGEFPGQCVLITEKVTSPEARERLQVVSETQDGFKIAEKDLEIRGSGELTGTRQTGIPEFLFGNLVLHNDLLELARKEAKRFVGEALESTSEPLPEILSRLTRSRDERFEL